MQVSRTPDFADPLVDATTDATTAAVPGAVLDDHRGWIERMRAMAATAVIVGVTALAAPEWLIEIEAVAVAD